MKKYLVEFIGTFFLVFTIGISGDVFAIAGVLMALIYMGGHISGAHYNPAVTMGFIMCGAIKWYDAIRYWVAQFAGAILAAGICLLLNENQVNLVIANGMLPEAILLEIAFTFAMMLVILNVAIAPAAKGNQYYGLAISSVVFAGIMAARPVSGGAFNPAVSLGFNIFNLQAYGFDTCIHALTALAGAGLGALVYKYTNR